MYDALNKDSAITPSIKKALRERANFYRRKLTFYENLGVLAVSLTSEEMGYKIEEARKDLDSSVNTRDSVLKGIDPAAVKKSLDKSLKQVKSHNSSISGGKSSRDSIGKKPIPIRVTKNEKVLPKIERVRPIEQRNSRF